VLSNYLLSTPKDLFYMEDMELLKILFWDANQTSVESYITKQKLCEKDISTQSE
jgi:hypothetical protein